MNEHRRSDYYGEENPEGNPEQDSTRHPFPQPKPEPAPVPEEPKTARPEIPGYIADGAGPIHGEWWVRRLP